MLTIVDFTPSGTTVYKESKRLVKTQRSNFSFEIWLSGIVDKVKFNLNSNCDKKFESVNCDIKSIEYSDVRNDVLSGVLFTEIIRIRFKALWMKEASFDEKEVE